ncbi:hypothetical protein D9758_013065 [Tetrapyrgos nigripes]|uniref:Uncharacterized protein n=1 Tax=Tetrapyrgos nigripes TaxID=182062 RepID=A0A8H5CQT3_9AGAR|nr:hypothetical protein D9758_013065 [Tetrapyrgos nigripes]
MIPVLFRILRFEPNNISEHADSQPRALKFTSRNMLLLPAISLFNIGHRSSGHHFDRFDSIECVFSSSSQVQRETRTLRSLASQLSYLGRIRLTISSVRSHEVRLHDSNHRHSPEPERGLRAIEWSIEMAQLMNSIMEREETVLEVVGINDQLTKAFHVYARRKRKREENEAERRKEEEMRRVLEEEMLKRKKNRAARRLSTALKKTVFPVLRKSRSTIDVSIAGSPTPQEVPSPASDTQPIDDSLPPCVKTRIRTFAIYSPILLQYPFLTWTTQIMSASHSSLRKVNVANLGPLTSFFLDEFRIPSLREFVLDVEDLETPIIPHPAKVFRFLANHPRITVLDLSRLSWNSPSLLERQPCTTSWAGALPPNRADFLPNLVALVATPEYLMCFFDLAIPARDNGTLLGPMLPKLTSVTIASDFYGMPPYGYQYTRFERVLRSLTMGRWTNLSLELRFLCRLGLIEWLESSFLPDPGSADLASLHTVTSLTLTTSGRFYFSSSILSALATWITRVPIFGGLRKITFGERCVFDGDEGGKEAQGTKAMIQVGRKLTGGEKGAVSREWVIDTMKGGCSKLARVVFGSDMHESS